MAKTPELTAAEQRLAERNTGKGTTEAVATSWVLARRTEPGLSLATFKTRQSEPSS